MAKVLPVAAPRGLNATKMQIIEPDVFEDANLYEDVNETTSLNQKKKPVIVKSNSKLGSIKQLFASNSDIEQNQDNFYLMGPTRIKLTDSQLSELLFHHIKKFYLEQAENSSSNSNNLNSKEEIRYEEQEEGFLLEGATRVKITDSQASALLYHQIKRHYSVDENTNQN